MDFGKQYFTSLHSRLIKNIYLNTELMLNDGVSEIFEYDIQLCMYNYLVRSVSNTGMVVKREAEGKTDCVIYNNEKPKQPVVFYEIKTFIKSNESILAKHFDQDISKLINKIDFVENSICYVVVVALADKIKGKYFEDLQFIESIFEKKSRKWHIFTLSDGTKVQIRPSVTERYGRSRVMSIEVKKCIV